MNTHIVNQPKKVWLKKITRYDLIVIVIAAIAIELFHVGYSGMHAHWDTHSQSLNSLSLAWYHLPYDALRTSLRLVYGLVWSFLFTFIFGVFAAKNKHAARVILPFINFMESVPLVGFLTFSIIFFMRLYPHNLMGLEATAIFGVFTSQVWNMTLTLYQTMQTIPNDLQEAARAYQLNGWQKFWKIELPYSIPGLLWNTMVSQSAAWFAIVATEAIAVGSSTLFLPGVGSYIQVAINQQDWFAVLYALITMVVTIILFDQLLFRPLVRWADKFKFERVHSLLHNSSWFYTVIMRATLLSVVFKKIALACKHFHYYLHRVYQRSFLPRMFYLLKKRYQTVNILFLVLWYSILATALGYGALKLFAYLPHFVVSHMLKLMMLTTARVALAMILSLVIFVPVGIWIGSSQKLTRTLQPIIQILAALPPNILFPMMTVFLVAFHQSLGWWTIPLIMIGTQWYILFNVIAGVSTLPQEIQDLNQNFGIKGFFSWRKVIIPGIFPYIVTGIISAAGGAWNADITAEVIQWGKTTLSTPGLGGFIANMTNANINNEALLGCILMCLLVALCIVFLWRPLYRLAETKFYLR